jgi:hypothetical protein
MKHPSETELALLAGGDCDAISRFFLNRHVRDCRECTAAVAQFEILRSDMIDPGVPDLDWARLESEIRANIHLGLEAGACVRPAAAVRVWNPRLTVAFASLLILAGAGLLLRSPSINEPATVKAAEPVLESTGAGLQLRNGDSSLTLMNHGSVADQTVSAQGEIRARYIDRGAVTINNVYLE